MAQENNDILEKVKEYGSGRKTSVIQQTNYLNNRYSVSLIGFSWTIGLKCAYQRQYLEERNFEFLNHSFSSMGSVYFNKFLLSIYSGLKQPLFDSQFYYSSSLCIHFFISEMEMTVLVLIVWDYFEDELNLMYVKYLNHACHFNTKGQQFRVRKFKDAHTVSDTGEQPNNFIFSDDAKKIFIKRLL